MQPKKIAIIGAGLMGHGLAQLFAQANYPVTLTDSDPATLAQALPRIHNNLQLAVTYDFIDAATAYAVPDRITLVSDITNAVCAADFIIEAVFEEMSVKHAVLRQIEAACAPEALIASNSSSFRVGDMALALTRRERFLGAHFWNPPHLVPLVEVTKGAETAPTTVDATCDLLCAVGKYPVRLHKDVAGFVGNRLQHALRREAIAIVAAGIASPEDVDHIARLSFGLRMPLLGPLETVDLGGLDLTLAIQSYLLPDLNRDCAPTQLVRDKVAAGELGVKRGKGFYDWTPAQVAETIRRRDIGLLELWAWLQAHGFGVPVGGGDGQSSGD
ncbi:MAG: 3-hydroxyacyl-CoA dehydrogenase family protein [Caldilinea sp. CFX5]|nr:3-hydroxyacyl-CoA dehydrogenase family protein [Caldilinea sp. CFX5]